jgi:hypothetical protein
VDAVAERVRADGGPLARELRVRVDPVFAGWGGGVDGLPRIEQVAAAIGGRTFAVEFAHGLEAACAAVMSGVQDEVIAMLWRPWPEVLDGDTPVGVLDVGLDPVGLAHWHLRSVPVCAVGQLASSCRARGWHVR